MDIERYTRRLGKDHIAIFLFHGVIEAEISSIRNYTRKHLPASDFRQLVEALASVGNPVSMDDVLAIIEGRQPLPPGAFAVTFDDGFENNISVAAPILRGLRVPHTVYLTTGFVSENRMSWIDRVEYCLQETAAETVRPPWCEAALPMLSAADRIAVADSIRLTVKTDPTIDVDAFVEDFFTQCGVPSIRSTDSPLDRKLAWAEVRAARELAGLTFGGHSHSHAILSFLRPAALADELDSSLRLLAREAGIEPRHYSYPEGLPHCYSPAVIDALKSRGVAICPTANDGINAVGSDAFLLKRIAVT